MKCKREKCVYQAKREYCSPDCATLDGVRPRACNSNVSSREYKPRPCRKGHPADRKYINTYGWATCRDCHNANSLASSQKRRLERLLEQNISSGVRQ